MFKILPIIAFFFLIFSQSLLFAQASIEIWEIQGEGKIALHNQQAIRSDSNIVTAVGNDFFFLQTPDNRSDDELSTSDGIKVYTGSNTSLKAGDLINIRGWVSEHNGMSQISNPNLEWTFISSGNDLPHAVELTEDFPGPSPIPFPELEKVEGMLVNFSAMANGPSTGSNYVPLTTKSSRIFREAGILFPGMNELPVWDGNPELFWMDPNGLDQPNNRFFATYMEINGTGVIEEDDGYYTVLPSSWEVIGDPVYTPVRKREGNEVTVGSFNTYLYGTYPSSDNYTDRIKKLAKYIVKLLNTPDILALQEVPGLNVLNDINYYIKIEDPESDYTPYLLQASGSLELAFLVKNSIQNVSVSQLGTGEYISLGGILHDRPPLLLEGEIKTNPPTPISVLNLHIRSLGGIEGSNATYVRTKRHEQAISIGNMVQARQDENLIIVGDYNAFEFSDGYVDVFNTISGAPSLGAQYTTEPFVNPPLEQPLLDMPEAERYSYVYNGFAQILDHCLTTQLQNLTSKDLQFGRANADNSIAYEDNENLAYRSSDHDGFVLFLQPDFPLNAAITSYPSFEVINPNPIHAGNHIIVKSDSNEKLMMQIFDLHGRPVLTEFFKGKNHQIEIPLGLVSGIYILNISSEKEIYTKKLVVGSGS